VKRLHVYAHLCSKEEIMKAVRYTLVAGVALLALTGTGMSGRRVHPLAPAVNHSPFAAQAQLLGGGLGVGTYNIDEHGRIPFQMTVHKEGLCSNSSCFFSFGFVPTGKRLVITRVTGVNVFNAAPTQVFVHLNNGTGSSVASFIPEVANFTTAYDHKTEAFFEAGQFIEVQVSPFPSTFLGGNALQVATVAGYMLTCNLTTPCSAFAATSPNHP